MGLNQNRNRESEVCDNIINQAANEAVNVWSTCDFCLEALGSKPPPPGRGTIRTPPQQEQQHLRLGTFGPLTQLQLAPFPCGVYGERGS